MTTAELVRNVVLLSEGKRETFASGSTKWLRIVDQGNFFLQQLSREKGTNWSRYYNPVSSFGTITETDSYAMPSTVNKLSIQQGDSIRVMHADAYTLDGALTGAAVTSVVVNEAINDDTPAVGSIRILRADGTYSKISYSSWNTSTFTITSTDFSTNNADDGAAAYVNNENYTDYTLVPHDRLKDYATDNYLARVGNTLKFNKTFETTDAQYGGEVQVPVYEFPDAFAADSDAIDIDDPNWLVFTVAADRVKNDVTRKDLRADLVAQANEALMAMIEMNGSQKDELFRPWSPTSHTNDFGWGD